MNNFDEFKFTDKCQFQDGDSFPGLVNLGENDVKWRFQL